MLHFASHLKPTCEDIDVITVHWEVSYGGSLRCFAGLGSALVDACGPSVASSSRSISAAMASSF